MPVDTVLARVYEVCRAGAGCLSCVWGDEPTMAPGHQPDCPGQQAKQSLAGPGVGTDLAARLMAVRLEARAANEPSVFTITEKAHRR